MVEKCQTHFYDGLLSLIPVDDNNNWSSEKLTEATVGFHPLALKYLNSILTGTHQQNYDPTNQICALDILKLFTPTLLANKDFLVELEVQLMDMTTGSCPQGRTHRLLQLLVAFSA
jgi:hypothetical protein